MRGGSASLATLPWLLAAAPLLADVEGTVTTTSGRPVEGAVVTDEVSGARAVSDARGRFRLRGVRPPAVLHVEEPRFEALAAELASEVAGPVLLTLAPKQTGYERVVVTAYPGAEAAAPVSASATAVQREDAVAPPATLVELALAAPGVAENGQGGRFQAYSVRGAAGQRVFTTLAGVRIVTERRAGATASFVDPALLGSVEVVRGPAATFYGSGALGGVVQALPRQIVGPELEAGVGSQGDERSVFGGWGGDGWTVGVAGRDAGDTRDGDGAFRFDHYTQASGLLRKVWERPSGTAFELLLLPAVAHDIAKPNARYPARVTRYPSERHLVARLTARRADGWRFSAFVHPNDLETENRTASERSLVTNESFDIGLGAQRELAAGGATTLRVGFDYFGRRDVTATEEAEDLASGAVTRSRTLAGREDQPALFVSARRPLGRATLEAGARVTRIGQRSRGAASSDTAGAGSVGVTLPLARGFELAANAGSGMRLPSLSERFFSGSTGRGEILANEGLEPERSLSADLGLRYFGTRLFAEVFGFRNAIDDYIEQGEVAPGVESFVNLTEGTIAGFDLDAFLTVSPSWRLTWSATHVRGRSDAGSPLADIPADRAALGARFTRGRWHAAARLEQRRPKDDPGPGELARGGASLFSASVVHELGRLELRLHGSNLLDDTYWPSADDLAVPAAGRSVGFGLRWVGSAAR